MPDVAARRALADRDVRFRLLAPVGAYAGRGMLRVLRVRSVDSGEAQQIELVCGYEGYEAFDVAGGQALE